MVCLEMTGALLTEYLDLYVTIYTAHLLIDMLLQVFLEQDSVLVSCSKDSYIRVWSLQSQHCFQTLGGIHGEVRSPTIGLYLTSLLCDCRKDQLCFLSCFKQRPFFASSATCVAKGKGNQLKGISESKHSC